MKGRILPWLLPLLLFVCWESATSGGLAPEYLLPSPGTVWETVCAYMGAVSEGHADAYAGRFWGDVSASLGRVASGYLLAAIPGVALGLASGRVPALASLLSPIINGIRAVPGISWLPLALLWLGIGFRATVFLIALAGFFPAYLNAAAGAASVPPVLIRAGRMLGFGRRAIFFRVVLPSAMPQVRTGLRVALGMSFSYLVLGELTGVPDGLGAMIMDARLAGRVDLLVSGHYPDCAGGVAMRRVACAGAFGGLSEPEAAMTPFFACSGIWKSFRKGGGARLVLPGVSVAVPRGGVLALIGASGCGKTTLLNILAGFDVPDAGTVTLEGRPCGGPGPDRAVVFQEPALFPWLTALENVEIGLEAAGVPPDARRARALDMLALTGLSGREGQIPAELSGGQKQRVALARVLALSPPVLLMDEPFAALDAITREQMQSLLMALHARIGMGIVLVTHDVEEALLLGDEVCVMASGQGIVASRRVEAPRTGEVADRELLRELKAILRQSMEGQGGPFPAS